MQTKQISDTLLSMTVNLLAKYDPKWWLVEWSGGGQQPAGDKSGVIMLAGSSGTSAVARPAAAPP